MSALGGRARIERKQSRAISGTAARFQVSAPEILTVAALLGFGSLFALTIPFGAGWDEETHLIRAWEIASLEFVPNRLPRNELPFPAIYWNLSYRRSPLVRPVESGFWAEYGDLPLDGFDYIYGELETRSVYSPPLLLPQALAIRYLGHALQLPALPVFYAARLFGLLAYVGLVWLAVRIAPWGKWLVALVSIAPTAVFQAATITADSISNGLGVLFIAGTLAIGARQEVGWKAWLVQLTLAALLFLAKPNLAFLALLPFLVIRRSQFKPRGGYALLLAGTAVLAAVEVGGWAAVALPRAGPGVGAGEPFAQLAYLVTHPLSAVQVVLRDAAQHGLLYLRQLVAGLGYDYWSVPAPVYILYAGALAAGLFASERGPSRRERVSLLIVFLVAAVGTQLTIYAVVNPAGSETIFGVQGRYFAAIVALPLLALIRLGPTPAPPAPARLVVALSGTALAAYAGGLLLVYHVTCGSSYFKPGLCYQPVYKNWAPDASYSAPVTTSDFMVQELVAECDGLRQVRVWVSGGDREAAGATEFVFRDPAADVDLARQQVANRELPNGGWYEIRVETQPASKGNLYLLSVHGEDDSTARIALTLRAEYDRGRLYQQGEALDVDMVFHYGCAAGLAQLNQ